MSRRKPSVSDLNIRNEQPIKRLKLSPTSTYRNIFEQFNDVSPSPTVNTPNDPLISRIVAPKFSSQQSSSTSSSTARSIMAKKSTKDNDELWTNVFQPKTRQELLLHSRKIKDLEELLQKSCEIVQTTKRPAKLILISGPAGSGKSTCLRLLAASLNINIIEWETRTTSNLTSTVLDEQRDDRQWVESQKRSFRTFVFQSTRYLSNSTNGLIFDDENEESTKSQSSSLSTKQIVLIEDLPNGSIRMLQHFIRLSGSLKNSNSPSIFRLCRELKRVAHHPIVFILTDNSSLSSLNNPHLLFSLSIIDELKIEQINFNLIAPTYMKKALESIIHQASLLKFKPPSRDCIQEIIQTANGDLRLAINTLQFSSNSKVKSSIGTVLTKDTCLSLFQGLGRILYKKDSEENATEPEILIEQCHISPPTFIGFLFENYIDFYSSIDDAAQLCDHLSLTEYILHDWQTRTQLLSIASSISCRAVRLCNSMPINRGFKPMRKPQDTDTRNRREKTRTLLSTNKLYYGCSEDEYYTTVLPYQAHLLKMTRSSTTNATNRSIVETGFLDRHSKKWHDMNSMVTEKNSSIGYLTDTQSDENLYNFSLIHATTIKFNQLEYDDNVDIDD